MPARTPGEERAPAFAEGLFDRSNAILISEQHASEVKNMNFDRLSAEESMGVRRMNTRRPQSPGVRFRPLVKRTSVSQMTRWRDGYAFAPLTKRLETEPLTIEAHFRLEEQLCFPEGGQVQVTRLYGGMTGRYQSTIGTQRNGGEHQFFPMVSRGAREVERPHFTLGIGIVRPQGLKGAALVDDSSADRISPVFAWWDANEQRLRVAAADFTVEPGVDYHVAIAFGGASSTWYVNGASVAEVSGFGLSALPRTTSPLFTVSLLPIFFGRCYTREPGIKYDAAAPVQHDKKHVYMGKFNCTVAAVGATTVRCDGQQLAFAAAVNGASGSYVGYRIRAHSAAGFGVTGRVFVIESVANATVDVGAGSITFTIPVGHGIQANDIIDVVPAIEPIAADVVVQEVRFWGVTLADQVIGRLAKMRLFSDLRSTLQDAHPLTMPDWGNQQARNLIAYWPMDDGGGTVIKELIGRADAHFAPSALALSDSAIGSSSSRALFLDGETQAVQVDLSEDPNFRINWPWNAGRLSTNENEWQLCTRMQIYIGGQMEATAAGSLQNHLYQVVFSIGNPKSGTPIIEARLTNFGANGLHIYFRVPDGTYQAIPVTLTPGRWYNAILGIEAPGSATGANPQTHRVYFRFVDADLLPAGNFSAAFTLARVVLDPAQDYVLSFGASVRGVAAQGVQDNNHALIGVSCLGVGSHPAHRLGSGAPTLALSEIIPLIRFSEIDERSGCVPQVTGQDGGCTLTQGSRNVTIASPESLPTYLRRFPIEVAHSQLEIVKKGEVTRLVPNNQIVQVVSGTQIVLMAAHPGYTIKGAELRAQVWAAYTNLETAEPGFDTDLNTGRDTGSSWAITKEVLKNLVGGVLRFDLAIAPTYEFVSPLRVVPTWDSGIVDRLDTEVRALKFYKRSDGRGRLLAVAHGSLFEVDDRWRRGHPFVDQGFGIQIRSKPTSDTREGLRRKEASGILVRNVRSYRNEAIKVIGGPSGAGGVTFETIEIDVWLDTLDGRQTLSSAMTKTIASIAGVLQWAWKKNHHFYVKDGDLVFEASDDVAGVWLLAKTSGNPIIRPNEWVRLQVELEWDGASPSTLQGITFRVNGREVASALTSSAAITDVNYPAAVGATYLGGMGVEDAIAFTDPLRGKIAGWAFRNSDDNYSYMGSDYEPGEITLEPGSAFGFTLGYGSRFNFGGLVLLADECVPVGHGMGLLDDQEVTIAIFGDVAYVNTGFSRPWRYDLEEFTADGIRPPAGRLVAVNPVRIPMRVEDLGADLPFLVGRANRLEINVASPQLRGFVGSNPTVAEGDIGSLVYVPHDPGMGAAGDYPPGYIGIVTAIDVATSGYVVAPAAPAEQLGGVGMAAWMLFRRAKVAISLAGVGYLAAVQLLRSTTPWGARRLLCDGKDNNSVPQTEGLVEGPTNAGCLHFRGNLVWESSPFKTAAMPVGRGKVLSVKGYLKLDTGTSFGDDQVVCELATDGDSGSFRIVVFGGGRIRFEFFDTLLGKFRSIATNGVCISPNQWYYLHFRYKFKAAGASVLDTVGGWEADLRWLRKGAAGIQIQKRNSFRDMLLIYACEGLHKINPAEVGGYVHSNAVAGYYGDVGEAVPCLLLTLPGCESSVGAATLEGAQAANNHSQHLLNVGLLKSAPYLTPEPGDSLFPAAGVNAASPRSGIEATLVSNLISNLQIAGVAQVGSQVGGAAPGGQVPQFTLPAGFALPRTCSMNRDDAFTRQANIGIESSSQIFQKVGGPTTRNFWNSLHVPASTLVSMTPNLASFGLIGGRGSYGKQEAWAVLVRVWTMVATGGGVGAVGAFPDGASAGVPRTLVLVHLNETDLGVASAGGVSGHRIFVSDDPLYGGDGLGNLLVGGAAPAVGSTWHVTIELPNGLNQAASSPNKLVCPSLLEHGENPVGVNDSPDQSLAPFRIGGTTKQGERGVTRRGFQGFLDDFGFLIAALAAHDTNIYTADQLAPDAFFTGPKDTRFQSLPRLNFGTNALIIDDPSGAPATAATAVYRCDELSGGRIVPDGSFSAQEAAALFLVTQFATSLPKKGMFKFWTSFYDRKQLVESSLSPEFIVEVEGKDGGGDFLEAETLFELVGIPVSGDRRENMSRRLYVSQADAALPLLLAQVDEDATVSFTPRWNETELEQADTGVFDNGRPPRSRAIFATETNMVHVGLDDAPSVAAISKANKPEHVPGTKILFGESGRGGGLVAANLTRGLLVIAKRNALFVITTAGALFRINRVGHSIGALGHNGIADLDGMLYFLSQKGVFTFAGNQLAYEASELIDQLYQTQLDIRSLWRSAGAALLDRGQYLVSVKKTSDREHRTILAAEKRFNEFGDPYYVWTVMELGFPISALCEFEDEAGESGKVAIASKTGMIALYNQGEGVGAQEDEPGGGLRGVVGASSSLNGKLAVTTMAITPNPLKGSLEGMPVIVVEELDAQGAVVTSGGVDYVIRLRSEVAFARNFTASSVDLYTRDQVAWSSYIGRNVIIGALEWAIRSKWFDGAAGGETVKAFDYLDLYFDPVPGGVAFLEIYVDFETANPRRFRVELDRGFFSMPITTIYTRHLQFRLKGYGLRTGFVLHRFDLRARPQEWAKRQKT